MAGGRWRSRWSPPGAPPTSTASPSPPSGRVQGEPRRSEPRTCWPHHPIPDGRATTLAPDPAIRSRYAAHFSRASRRCSRHVEVLQGEAPRCSQNACVGLRPPKPHGHLFDLPLLVLPCRPIERESAVESPPSSREHVAAGGGAPRDEPRHRGRGATRLRSGARCSTYSPWTTSCKVRCVPGPTSGTTAQPVHAHRNMGAQRHLVASEIPADSCSMRSAARESRPCACRHGPCTAELIAHAT